MSRAAPTPRLLVASNRLPVELTRSGRGKYRAERSSGGLVAALVPVLRNRGGIWIGWPGTEVEPGAARNALSALDGSSGYELRPVFLTAEERTGFYQGFCNEIIWPLFHDLVSHCNFDPAYWEIYKRVNRYFAAEIDRNTGQDTFVWVHDYQLLNVAADLRALGNKSRTAFFLHIPFPPLDIFEKLPWRRELLEAMLQYDLLGFQTQRHLRNFITCARTLIPALSVRDKGRVRTLDTGQRVLRAGSFPIGIDSEGIAQRAASPAVTERMEAMRAMLPGRQLMLGVDRLDYTKGIPYRLQAFANALERYPALRERVTLIQVVVPSRANIPQYQELKMSIERLVGEINGRFTRPGGWVPIHYVYRSLDYADLLAYYRAAQVALITPFKDGMNLVAKEYCAASVEEDCVLILSEFAGAAAQLGRNALLVNPYDIVGMADAIHAALMMDVEERRRRMRRLRQNVRDQDIFTWLDWCLRAAIEKELDDFPAPEEDLAWVDLHDEPTL